MREHKQLIQGLAFALLVTLCGFMLFVRPNLDGGGQAGAPADPESRIAAVEGILPAGTAPKQVTDKLTELAGSTVQVARAKGTVVQDVGGPAYRVELEATGKTSDLLAYLSTLSRATYREGSQVRGNGGPLYIIEKMTLTPATPGNAKLVATLLIPGTTS